MKKTLTMVVLILLCFSMTSCGIVEILRYTISDDIIDPVDGFFRDEDGVLIYNGNKYIVVDEINGDCEIDIRKEDVLLGYSSYWPFFPNTYYYTTTDDNPSFIMGGNGSYKEGTFVFLREDLYINGFVYALQSSSLEFEFTSSFIKTDKVNYDSHIKGEKFTRDTEVYFYMKEIPIIKAHKAIYLIDNTWYCVEFDVAYQLSDEFLGKLRAEGIIN